MHIPTLTLSCILLTAHITAMEVPEQSFPLLNCKEESAAIMTTIIAYSESKDALRKTCARVRDIMHNREAILKHPLLRINQNALSKFFPYYGALGKTEIVRNLATKDTDSQYYPLMTSAIVYEYNEIISILLNQSNFINFIEDLLPDPSLVDNLLRLAVKFNHMDIVKKVLSTLKEKNKSIWTRAKVALLFFEVEDLKKFNIFTSKPEYTPEESAFYYCILGHCAMVKKLLSEGIDPNTHNEEDKSLMHYAAEYGYLDIVNILLEHPKFIKTDIALDEASPLYLAMGNGHRSVIKRFLETYTVNIEKIISDALKHHLLSSIHILLECNSDTNSLNNKQCTTLLGCVFNTLDNNSTNLRYLPIMQKLITRGASVDTSIKRYSYPILEGCGENIAPLHVAAWTYQIFVTQLLIDSGADVNIKTKNNCTPLHIASGAGNAHIVKMLIGKDAHINAKDNNGNTPLHTAIANLPDHSDLRYFLENISEEKQDTLAALLTDPKININEKNNDNKTPLDLVTNRNLRNLSISRGAKTNNELEKAAKQEDCSIQ